MSDPRVPDEAVPARVTVMLGSDERRLAHVIGRHDSGVLVTDRRLFAWRVNGVSPPLELAAIDRIQHDRGPADALLVVPRAAAHVPLVVMVAPDERAAGEALVAVVRDAVIARAQAGGSLVAAEEGEFMGIWAIRFRRG